MGQSQHLFSVTISAKRKPGMDEDAYHKYISETHAGHLKELLVQNKIVDYSMVSKVILFFRRSLLVLSNTTPPSVWTELTNCSQTYLASTARHMMRL